MADRVERLTNLLALLLETPQPLSLVEIGAELRGQYSDDDAARRAAFERDKAALRSIGVPIDTEIVAGGAYAGQTRYWIDRRKYELTGLELETDELRALQVAIATVRTGDSLGDDALLKVASGSGTADDDGSQVSSGAVSAFMPSTPELPVLRDAVSARARLRFRYRETDRCLEPWGVLLRSGFWYVIGRDVDRDSQRIYRVDRIEEGSIEIDEPGAFVRPAGFEARSAFPADPKQFGATGDERVDARVRVSAVRSAAVVRELGDDRVLRRLDDGAVEVAVPATNVRAFRSWVLGLGTHAVVLEPADVRAEIVAWLTRIASEQGSVA